MPDPQPQPVNVEASDLFVRLAENVLLEMRVRADAEEDVTLDANSALLVLVHIAALDQEHQRLREQLAEAFREVAQARSERRALQRQVEALATPTSQEADKG